MFKIFNENIFMLYLNLDEAINFVGFQITLVIDLVSLGKIN